MASCYNWLFQPFWKIEFSERVSSHRRGRQWSATFSPGPHRVSGVKGMRHVDNSHMFPVWVMIDKALNMISITILEWIGSDNFNIFRFLWGINSIPYFIHSRDGDRFTERCDRSCWNSKRRTCSYIEPLPHRVLWVIQGSSSVLLLRCYNNFAKPVFVSPFSIVLERFWKRNCLCSAQLWIFDVSDKMVICPKEAETKYHEQSKEEHSSEVKKSWQDAHLNSTTLPDHLIRFDIPQRHETQLEFLQLSVI